MKYLCETTRVNDLLTVVLFITLKILEVDGGQVNEN